MWPMRDTSTSKQILLYHSLQCIGQQASWLTSDSDALKSFESKSSKGIQCIERLSLIWIFNESSGAAILVKMRFKQKTLEVFALATKNQVLKLAL